MVTAIAWLGPERMACSTRRMAEGRDIAALLQVEADLIDAAGRIDREHQLQVDRGLRRRRHGRGQCEHQPADGAASRAADGRHRGLVHADEAAK